MTPTFFLNISHSLIISLNLVGFEFERSFVSPMSSARLYKANADSSNRTGDIIDLPVSLYQKTLVIMFQYINIIGMVDDVSFSTDKREDIFT